MMATNTIATTTVKAIHTLISHILHNIHNQGIFINLSVLLPQWLAYKTLLSKVRLVSIPIVSANHIDTTNIPNVHSFFFYKPSITSKACRPLFIYNVYFITFWSTVIPEICVSYTWVSCQIGILMWGFCKSLTKYTFNVKTICIFNTF